MAHLKSKGESEEKWEDNIQRKFVSTMGWQ